MVVFVHYDKTIFELIDATFVMLEDLVAVKPGQTWSIYWMFMNVIKNEQQEFKKTRFISCSEAKMRRVSKREVTQNANGKYSDAKTILGMLHWLEMFESGFKRDPSSFESSWGSSRTSSPEGRGRLCRRTRRPDSWRRRSWCRRAVRRCPSASSRWGTARLKYSRCKFKNSTCASQHTRYICF